MKHGTGSKRLELPKEQQLKVTTMETMLESMAKKFETQLEAQFTAHRAETEALQVKIQALTDAVEHLSVSSSQREAKATSNTQALDKSSIQDTEPTIKNLSEDDIDAIAEGIKAMARIKQARDLPFPRMGKRCFDDWFESLERFITDTIRGDPDHPQLRPYAYQLLAMAVRNEPTVREAYYGGNLVRREQGDDSWAAVRADLRDLLMPRKLIQYRGSWEYVNDCRQEPSETITRYNHRFRGVMQRYHKYFLEVHGLTIQDRRVYSWYVQSLSSKYKLLAEDLMIDGTIPLKLVGEGVETLAFVQQKMEEEGRGLEHGQIAGRI
ncbi:MAG: hypothetical protein BYD32DRAFT_463570 [Podila humilis]|nr:MAG: hypothetical protein BYD32DRAFT_463570 [Podila humilis]